MLGTNWIFDLVQTVVADIPACMYRPRFEFESEIWNWKLFYLAAENVSCLWVSTQGTYGEGSQWTIGFKSSPWDYMQWGYIAQGTAAARATGGLDTRTLKIVHSKYPLSHDVSYGGSLLCGSSLVKQWRIQAGAQQAAAPPPPLRCVLECFKIRLTYA